MQGRPPQDSPPTRAPAPLDEVWLFTSELEGERAGSFRQERWCRVFLEDGARVSAFNLNGAFAVTEARFESVESFVAFRKRALGRARPAASVRQGLAARLIRRMKHLLLADLYLPSVVKLFLRARARLAGTDGRVVLMASSPPFSVVVVAAMLKRLYPSRIVFAADMRDAWALHGSLGGIRPLKRLIERRALLAADAVSTVSHGLEEEFEATYGVPVDVHFNVATHYFDVSPAQPVDWSALHPDIDAARAKVVYTGSTPEGFFDVAAVVEAVKELRATRPELADRLQLVFVGACEEAAAEAARRGGAGHDIVFVPHVAHELARAVQQNADALLFLAYRGDGNKGVVSTKFFEYLALGRPILPVSLHVGSDVDRLLRTYCGSSLNLHTAAELRDALRGLAEGTARLPRLEDAGKVRHLVEDYREFARSLRAR